MDHQLCPAFPGDFLKTHGLAGRTFGGCSTSHPAIMPTEALRGGCHRITSNSFTPLLPLLREWGIPTHDTWKDEHRKTETALRTKCCHSIGYRTPHLTHRTDPRCGAPLGFGTIFGERGYKYLVGEDPRKKGGGSTAVLPCSTVAEECLCPEDSDVSGLWAMEAPRGSPSPHIPRAVRLLSLL